MRGLERIIDPRKDDVRCYPLPERAEIVLLGPQLFPDDILLFDKGRNLLRLGAETPRWFRVDEEGRRY
ncbi:MAG: hypothetical protein V9G63_09390 [Candidatus Competibacter sp.]